MAKRSGDTLQLDGFDFTKSRRFPKLVPQIRSRSFKYADPEILSQLNESNNNLCNKNKILTINGIEQIY